MTARAYILIEVLPSKSPEVVRSLGTLSEVKAVDRVTGPYDVVAVIEAADLSAVGALLTGKVHAIDGIRRTVTCVRM
ncbi:MAG: Lrp/AsnC ligand binding domain-containing protein [Chloroflexi bacterium]|nr:Lrp/AsnC ligand binding domain-containing protein [Chloroflexota bacterium]